MRCAEGPSVDFSGQNRRLIAPPVPEPDFQPIRFKFEYVSVSGNFIQELQDSLIDQVVNWLDNVIQIVPRTDKLVLQRKECSGLAIPEKYTTDGVSDIDIVIFVTESTSDENTAWGIPCELNSDENSRPIAGWINFTGNKFSQMTWLQKFAMVIHQISHVLAYHAELFPYFQDRTGELYGIDSVTGDYYLRNSAITFLKSPELLRRARKAFNCPSMPGVDLENTGDYLKSAVHWDKRIMYNDFMTSDLNSYFFQITDISLAVFEDSGWYKVNYDYSTEVVWGYQQGCEFLQNQCVVNKIPQFTEFCNSTQAVSYCDHMHHYKGMCNLSTLTELIPAFYQYFDGAYLGGRDKYLDYCPIVEPFDNGSCRDVGIASPEISKDVYGEEICDECRCLEGTYVNQLSGQAIHHHAGCHRITCQGNMAVIHVGQEQVFCEPQGGPIEVRGYDGVLYCPPSDVLCRGLPCPYNCNAKGKCVDNHCECHQSADKYCWANSTSYIGFILSLMLL